MTPVVKEINKYITMLSPEEQQALALALKMQVIISESESLSSFVPRKKILVSDIVKQVNISRKKEICR